MVIYLAGLQGVPREMYEVAALDGASPWQRLRHVTLPMISPVILFTVILQLVLCVSYFTQAQVIENAAAAALARRRGSTCSTSTCRLSSSSSSGTPRPWPSSCS